jgi:Mg2+ and Co2+ transporter CorA
MIRTFAMSFFQVGLVAVNTKFIQINNLSGIFLTSCIVSLIWTMNVNKMTGASLKQKLSYALGAGVGSMVAISIF